MGKSAALCPMVGSSVQEKPGALGMIRELEHLFGEDRLREPGLFGLEKKRLRGNLINVQKCLKGGCQEDGVGLFFVVLSNGMRGNGHKQKQRNFHLNTIKTFPLQCILGDIS